MPKLPSFRPRAALGVVSQDGMVRASPEFLRWLDIFTRQADETTVFVETEQLAPIVMPSQGHGAGLSPFRLAVSAAPDLAPLPRPCAPQNGLAPL